MYMEKKKSAAVKIILSIMLTAVISLSALFLYFFIPSLKIKLDYGKLTDETVNLSLYDNEDKKVANSDIFSSGDYIVSEDIPREVKDCFVFIEDKRFYDHNGVDIYRIGGAMLENIKSMRFKEGASTITQQLIKNTHLTNEKSMTRKFAEIRLATELERQYSKEKILEMYLNSVYFGNNVYGIVKAAEYYFNKDVVGLTLAESAALAGIINAPNAYAPNKNADKCVARRNLVLAALLENNKITRQEYETAVGTPLNTADAGKKSPQKNYADMAVTEACEILGITKSQLKHSGFKIFTYLDRDKQREMKKALDAETVLTAGGADAQKMGLSVNNSDGGIQAFFSYTNENPYYVKRGVGSTAKPLVALAPAFEQKAITPSTMILDEKTNFGGYSPKNINDRYDGWITVRSAIATSKNVPAVKLLNSLDKAAVKNYLMKLGYLSADDDVDLRMALGGFDKGLSIMQLSEGYMMLANGGEFRSAAFVRKIEDTDGRVLYTRQNHGVRLLRDDSAFLTTDILKDVVSDGTGKNLGVINAEVAGKTGTVGKAGSPNNSDAIFCAYSPCDTTVFWVYSDYEDLLESGVSGSNVPVACAKNYYNAVYTEYMGGFKMPRSVIRMDIDKKALEEDGKIIAASPFTDKKETVSEIFSIYNRPAAYSAEHRVTPDSKNTTNRKADFWQKLLDMLKRPLTGAF